MTPTARSLKYLRDNGWLADVVERLIPGEMIRKDLYGVGDILAIRKGGILIVQTTSGSNVSARVKKITEHENMPKIREAGIGIHIHGWRRIKGRWAVRVVDVS